MIVQTLIDKLMRIKNKDTPIVILASDWADLAYGIKTLRVMSIQQTDGYVIAIVDDGQRIDLNLQ